MHLSVGNNQRGNALTLPAKHFSLALEYLWDSWDTTFNILAGKLMHMYNPSRLPASLHPLFPSFHHPIPLSCLFGLFFRPTVINQGHQHGQRHGAIHWNFSDSRYVIEDNDFPWTRWGPTSPSHCDWILKESLSFDEDHSHICVPKTVFCSIPFNSCFLPFPKNDIPWDLGAGGRVV